MAIEQLCILGAGNIYLWPNLFASIAGYFGERPLEIRMHDENLEFLKLNYRLGLVLLQLNKSSHRLIWTSDLPEAMEGTEAVLVLPKIDPCDNEDELTTVWPSSLFNVSPQKELLCVGARAPKGLRFLSDWPKAISSEWLGFQILRWINGEEYPFELLHLNEDSPINRWLENPSVIEL